jgi:hypothetical protein
MPREASEPSSALSRFAYWGLASYLAIGLGFVVGVIGAALERKWIVVGTEVPALSWQSAAAPLVFLLMGVGFASGWVALYYGRQVRCESCARGVLGVNAPGFQGLRVGLVLAAVRGQVLCPACDRVKHA